MSEEAVGRLRALVAVNRDPWTNRRTREVIATVRRLGWDVTVVGASPSEPPVEVEQVVVGDGVVAKALGPLHGPITRNLTRVTWTILTLLPERWAKPAVSWASGEILGLRNLVQALEDGASVVVVEDLLLLPTVLRHRGSSRVYFDAREFFPRQFENSRLWRALVGHGYRRALVAMLPECDAVTTVSPGLRTGYEELCSVRATTILNVPPRQDFHAHTPVCDSRGDPPAAVRLVFHGLANRNRGLEVLIELGRALVDEATVDLYLTGSRTYRRKLARAASTLPNVTVQDPVPFTSIVAMLGQYDLGTAIYPGEGFNLIHSLPSKFFEYLHAGLPVLVGPSPDMAAIVRHYDCGVVGRDFRPETLAAEVRRLTPARMRELAANARRAAQELVADVEYRKLERILLGSTEG